MYQPEPTLLTLASVAFVSDWAYGLSPVLSLSSSAFISDWAVAKATILPLSASGAIATSASASDNTLVLSASGQLAQFDPASAVDTGRIAVGGGFRHIGPSRHRPVYRCPALRLPHQGQPVRSGICCRPAMAAGVCGLCWPV